MSKLSDFYSDLDTATPYINREQMEQMLENSTTFSVIGVNERVGQYMGKPREEWVVTLQLDEDDAKVLCTFVKTANRDKFMQSIAQRLPVSDCKFARKGKAKSWVFVPSDYDETDYDETENAEPAKKRGRK